jgi:hypothetical protein
VEGQHLSSLKRGSGEMVHSDTISNINWIVHLQRRRGKVTRRGGGLCDRPGRGSLGEGLQETGIELSEQIGDTSGVCLSPRRGRRERIFLADQFLSQEYSGGMTIESGSARCTEPREGD